MKKKEERFEEYKSWVLKHNRYPSTISDNEIEKSLGFWRNNYRRKNFKPLLDFDEKVNFKFRKSQEKRFEEYKSWVLEHEKYPSQRSNDKIERPLGIWRKNCRKRKFKPLLVFDEKVNFSSLKSSEERFEEYKSWVLKHKKYPRRRSDDETERSLGQWRSRQRIKNFKPLLDFDKEVNFSSPKSSEERFEEYRSWVLEHKKYPSTISKDKTERSLGIWRNKQRKKNFIQLDNFDIFYSNYLIGNRKAVEIFNELKEKGIV